MKKAVSLLFLIITINVLILSFLAADSAYLGVYLNDLTIVELENLEIDHGVRIDMVISDSPAFKSGLMPDDIIIKINDTPISSQEQIRKIIKDANPGDEVVVYYLSGNMNKKAAIILGDLSKTDISHITLLDTKTKHIGVKLQNLTGQLKEFFQSSNGVLIAEVVPGTPAESAGLLAGDVIVSADGQEIDEIKDLTHIIKSKEKGDFFQLEYVRNGESHQVEVEIAEIDELFKFDLNNEIIFLGKKEIDLSEIENWFDSVLSEMSKEELESKIRSLQKEINKIRREIFNQRQ